MATIVVTGSAGAIGRPVCDELLCRGYHVRGFDRSPTPSLSDSVVADLVDRAAVRAALRGADAVVHLAAEPDDADFALLEGPNVRGLFHVLDAARQEQVRRVVLASSIQVLGKWWVRAPRPASSEDALPVNHYGLTKLWAEQMGEMYARVYGLSVIAARIAFMVRNPDEARRLAQLELYDTYLSRGDAARFFVAAIEAPAVDFAVLYAVGLGGERLFDMDATARLIGFEPRDRWPDGLGFPAPLEV
ncbi:MAG TPA: NAD(P)-dependent oxidoreductase [Polyangiaceae bacterium]|nr:NAD(P)-dependent oxidoreductase [Polyangiaceae bacterium]